MTQNYQNFRYFVLKASFNPLNTDLKLNRLKKKTWPLLGKKFSCLPPVDLCAKKLSYLLWFMRNCSSNLLGNLKFRKNLKNLFLDIHIRNGLQKF